jgi:hypothetical protein
VSLLKRDAPEEDTPQPDTSLVSKASTGAPSGSTFSTTIPIVSPTALPGIAQFISVTLGQHLSSFLSKSLEIVLFPSFKPPLSQLSPFLSIWVRMLLPLTTAWLWSIVSNIWQDYTRSNLYSRWASVRTEPSALLVVNWLFVDFLVPHLQMV